MPKPTETPPTDDPKFAVPAGPKGPGPAETGRPAPSRKNGAKALVKAFLVFAVLGALIFGWWHLFRRGTVSTDDAYVQGNIVRVAPLAGGTVVEILADNTQRVKKGDTLIRLDATDAALSLETAKNGLRSACLNLKSLDATKNKLAANVKALESELFLARNDRERGIILAAKNSISAAEMERHEAALEIAGARLAAAKEELASTLSLLGPGPPDAHPSILLAAAAMEEAWLNLARSEIKSPVSGKVAKRTAQLGSRVNSSAPVLMVAADDELWVDANFKESQLRRIKPGMPARVTVDMLGKKTVIRGVVEGLGAGTGSVFSLLPPENATGNWIKVVQRVPVRITLDADDLGDAPLILGLSCRVEIRTDGTTAANVKRRERWNFKTEVLTEDVSGVRALAKEELEACLGTPDGFAGLAETAKTASPSAISGTAGKKFP
ncbi:MAG: HlyD family secretion protein [Deltaproteobacteria bacterium]|jgi:membrane fusion protein (multidrug efflux system)|nr:HlyD family secretion protein [Deltaproteobacteria bacterium]